MAFRRILDALELPHQRIILQLPLITPSQRWVFTHVAENYRRNGFRIGANAGNLEQANDLLERIRPDSIKIDINQASDPVAQSHLLEQAERQACKIIFKRIENEAQFQTLQKSNNAGSPFYVQGFLFDLAKANLAVTNEEFYAYSAHTKLARPSSVLAQE
jgi:EAL domain-containing protein (putative c-di-GMP-specific phosphodiesterase class I)